MPILGKSKIWGKGYTTIPNAVRKILELENGVEIKWIYVDGEVIIKNKDEDKK